MTAAAVAGVTAAVAASAVATAPAAKAAPAITGPILVLGQNGSAVEPETTLLQAAGYTVTQSAPSVWRSMTTAQFQAYAALVIGDPSHVGACDSTKVPTTASSGDEGIGTAWQAAVTGNVAVLGTSPATVQTTASNALTTSAAEYAASAFVAAAGSSPSAGTGMYISLNCDYSAAAANTNIPVLNGVEGIGTAGGLSVQGHLACTDPGSLNKWEATAAGAFDGLTSDSLGTSSWPSPGCPVQEAFNSWPAMFTPVAYDAASDALDNFTASSGLTGQPYILLGAPVSSGTLSLSPGTGGAVPPGSTVGGANAAASGISQPTAGKSVNTENGDFSQSATDFSIPGFGPALNFTRTYDSQQARQQTVAGTPGPMGYGWTDNWATYEIHNRPMPGDIYTLNTPGVSLSSPADSGADAAGDVFISNNGANNVVEIAAATHTQFGISMTAGNAYVVAGSAAGTAGSSGNGGVATSALLNGPAGVAVDASGNLYIADTGNNRIDEVAAATGTQWGQSMTANHIYRIAGSASGAMGVSGDGGVATSALFADPVDVRVDGPGNVYVVDSFNCRIQEVAAHSGTQRGVSMTANDIYTIAGSAAGTPGYSGDGGLATSAKFDDPSGLTVDPAGDLYVTDALDDVAREVAGTTRAQWGRQFTANDIYTVAGSSAAGGHNGDGGPATSAQLFGPIGVATSSTGDLYIDDNSNNRIQEVPVASGTQWGQSMTAGDMYTIAGSSTGAQGSSGDGGPASGALFFGPWSITIDPYNDLLIPDIGNNVLREVFNSTSQLFNTSPAGSGNTVIQPDGSRIDFQRKLSSGACPTGYVLYPRSGVCTIPQNVGVTLNQSPATHVYTYRSDPRTTYSYSSTGVLLSITNAAGDTLTAASGTPGPGNNCPATAATCQVLTAASGRALAVGSNSSGRVTSVTDPMGRRWTYAYNSASQLTSATSPMGNVTTYTYGAGSTGNPQLASDLLTMTSPNAQPGGPAAGHSTVNVYDSLGRVTSQTDPMGFATTFNYCVSATAGNCMNAATGNGFVTVNDPDGNHAVYDYAGGTLAAQSSFTGSTLTSENDHVPDSTATLAGSGSSITTTGGTFHPLVTVDGSGTTVRSTLDQLLGNATSSVVPTATGTATLTSSYATQNIASQDFAYCSSTALTASSATCDKDSPPVPQAPGQAITPPSSAPPLGVTYTLYDTTGNELYSTTGVYQPGASSASYSQTTYQLFNGNNVTLNGNTISCATTAPSPSLPCARIDADGVVTQFAYDSAGDLASSATPDGNGPEVATMSYAYDGDGEKTSQTSPDGNLPGANPGNFTTITAYNSDGKETSASVAGGSGATVSPHVTSHGYDADGNQVTETNASGYVTTTGYNADDRATTVTDPVGDVSLACYDGDGNIVQTVPPSGVAGNSLTAASCPAGYPAGYGTRLADSATVTTFNADGKQAQQTTPAPVGQSGFETTTYEYDDAGNLTKTTAPPVSNGGPNQVTVSTYAAGQLASTTVGYGTAAASTTSFCYDPTGNKTAVVPPDANASGTAPCETSSPWVVSSASYPAQASYQTTYSYDSAGDQVAATTPATSAAPAGATTASTYDPAGNKLTSTDPNGITSTWTYTPTGKPASVTYSGNSAHAVSYTYDANRQRIGMSDATGNSSYAYDPYGQLASHVNGAGQTVGYTYDATGNVTSVAYPLPASATWATTNEVTYTYDHASRLGASSDFAGNEIVFSSNADSLPVSITLGATGDTITASYDATDSPSSISLANGSGTLQSFAYSAAPSGDTLSEADTPAGAQSPATFTYDGQDRVASLTTGTSATRAYAFDPSSDLTSLPTGATGTYDNSGELTSSALAGSTTSYAYASNGQRLSATQGTSATASGTWDGAARLTSYGDSAADMTSAAYDGDGLRQSSAITPAGGSAATQGYVWDTQAQLPQLIMDGTNAYVYAGGPVTAEQVNLATGAVTYLLTDSLGSVRAAVSSSGSLIGATSYDAWGNPQATGGLAAITPFGYAGGYTDADGLIYLQARYYEPATGQFLSADPLLAQTLQPYVYANGNPVSEIDPSGESGLVRWTIVRATYIGSRIGPWHNCTWVDYRFHINQFYCQKSVSVSTSVSGSLEVPLGEVSADIGVSIGTTTETASGGYVTAGNGVVGWIQWAAVQPQFYVNQRKWIGGAGPRGGGIIWHPTNTHAYATVTTSGDSSFTFRFVQCRKIPPLGNETC
jgi:RHS repeat-associated protein